MPPKPDVRRLLKKQQTERNKEIKVTHPFAKYDETNRLICIVCNAPVKNPTVWQAHLGSIAHRDNIQKLKALKQQQQQNLKRKAPSPPPPPTQDTKRSRMEEIELDEQPDSSSEEEQEEQEDEEMGLPADFFDDSAEPIEEDDDDSEEKQNGSIPTGFFDDPEQEARMQGNLAPEEQAQANLEKDLEDFNEAMIDVTKESKEEQEQDDETFWLERHQDISEEQALLDQRVEKLKIMRQQKQIPEMGKKGDDGEEDTLGLKSSVRQLLKTKVVQQTESMFEDESESEEEEEDWRAQQL